MRRRELLPYWRFIVDLWRWIAKCCSELRPDQRQPWYDASYSSLVEIKAKSSGIDQQFVHEVCCSALALMDRLDGQAKRRNE